MQISYIYHSGFLVETKECYYLFDYYKGALPRLKADKPIFVFASHSHSDHYNKEIFTLLEDMGMQHITAVLAKDIPPRKYPQDVEVQRVTFHETYNLPCHTTLETLLSTDAGVAFLVRCPEGILYHAGDLNDWVWEGEPEQDNRQMTGSYRHEINLLDSLLQGASIDAAFLPLDSRQENDYARGMLYFLKKINVKQVYPMHYWEKPEIIGQFLKEYPEYEGKVVRTEGGENGHGEYGILTIAEIDELDRYRAAYTLFSSLQKAEARAEREGWIDADELEKELEVSVKMKFKMIHENYNVADLERSIAFYEKALGLHEVRRKNGEGFIIVYMGNEESDFELELTWLEEHPGQYDLGECEFHLAFRTDDYDAAHRLHEEMGCICFENPAMGIYFIQDPDGYWLEIIPAR